VRVPIQDPVICAELKDMLTLSAQYQERQLAQKKSRSVGEARQQELRELEELRERKKHVLMTLFTKSGEAKLPAVVKQLEAFLDDPMSGKVRYPCNGSRYLCVLSLLTCPTVPNSGTGVLPPPGGNGWHSACAHPARRRLYPH
jgi:hypothetical protein